MSIQSEHNRNIFLQFLNVELLDALFAKYSEYYSIRIPCS